MVDSEAEVEDTTIENDGEVDEFEEELTDEN